MDRVEDCISFLVGKAAQQVARRARDKLTPHGVTPVQYAVLRALHEQDGQSAAELGARLAIDSATTTGVIDRLEAAGLLRRQPHDEDRRIHRVVLTARAGSLQAELDRGMDELNAEILDELGVAEGEALWGALRRLGGVKGPEETKCSTRRSR